MTEQNQIYLFEWTPEGSSVKDADKECENSMSQKMNFGCSNKPYGAVNLLETFVDMWQQLRI